jgi:hypothetical protein
MKNRSRLVETLGSVIALEAGIFAVCLTLLLVRELPLSMARQVPSLVGRLAIAAGAALFCCVVFEASYARIRDAVAMNDRNLAAPGRNLYGLFAVFDQYADLVRSMFFFLVMLIVDAGVGYLVSRNRPSLTTELGAYVAVFPIWLIARKPLLSSLGRLVDSGQPRYEIAPAGDALLITRITGQRKDRGPIRIGFDELDDIRVFNSAEASAYRQYELGPNVELGIRQTKDLYDFSRGAIPRPSVYAVSAGNSMGKSVLMRGPNLFYWIYFGGQDGSDIVAAWARYRGASPTPGRAGA